MYTSVFNSPSENAALQSCWQLSSVVQHFYFTSKIPLNNTKSGVSLIIMYNYLLLTTVREPNKNIVLNRLFFIFILNLSVSFLNSSSSIFSFDLVLL